VVVVHSFCWMVGGGAMSTSASEGWSCFFNQFSVCSIYICSGSQPLLLFIIVSDLDYWRKSPINACCSLCREPLICEPVFVGGQFICLLELWRPTQHFVFLLFGFALACSSPDSVFVMCIFAFVSNHFCYF
jgi:hypothetical protein